MNKIDKLIKEKCPNGVRYKEIGEVCCITKGKQLNKEVLLGKGPYPVINGGINPSGYWNEFNFNENLITISQGGASAGYINYIKTKFWAGAHCFVVEGCKEEISYKYLYHFLKQNEKYLQTTQVGAGIPSVSLKDINSLRIPIPPIEIQKEIIKVLDKFNELESELNLELEARKIEYEFWRSKLLDINKNSKKIKFGNVADIARGASPRPIKDFISSDENGVNWIKIGDVNPNDKYVVSTKEKITLEGAKKSRYVKKGDFILSNSMSFGRPYILKIDGCIHDGWLSISNFENTFMPDFLYHLLSCKNIQDAMKQKVGIGIVQNLNADIVKSIELPIYPIDEQKKIVEILDNFEKLTNSATEGLPAEIELRKKQYEYYRRKLLSFKEVINE